MECHLEEPGVEHRGPLASTMGVVVSRHRGWLLLVREIADDIVSDVLEACPLLKVQRDTTHEVVVRPIVVCCVVRLGGIDVVLGEHLHPNGLGRSLENTSKGRKQRRAIHVQSFGELLQIVVLEVQPCEEVEELNIIDG
jgi:hypothetical protein